GLALVLLAALVDAGEAVLQALAAVADEVLQGGQLPQFLGPLLAVPAGRQPAAQPTLAVWLHHHQHWLLSEEDLITGAVANARPGVLVADRQQRPGAEAGLVAVPAQLGDAGGVLTQQDGEEAAGDGQADAFGLGGAGELGLQRGGDDDGLAQLVLEAVEVRLPVGELLVQAVELLLLRGRVEVAEDGVGLTVETLPRDAALLGEVADGAARAEADDGGAGQTLRGYYEDYGVRACGDAVGGSSASLQLPTLLLSTPAPLFWAFLRKSPSVRPTAARIAMPPICFGHIDRCLERPVNGSGGRC